MQDVGLGSIMLYLKLINTKWACREARDVFGAVNETSWVTEQLKLYMAQIVLIKLGPGYTVDLEDLQVMAVWEWHVHEDGMHTLQGCKGPDDISQQMYNSLFMVQYIALLQFSLPNAW